MRNEQLQLGIILTVILSCDAITVSSNGNSPTGKMPAVNIKDIEFGGFVPINPFKAMREEKNLVSMRKHEVLKVFPEEKHDKIAEEEKSISYLNNTKLPVNERYRRLIPYMTFYLANDFNSPHKEQYTVKPQLQNVAIPSGEAANGKHVVHQYSNIPKYQGNRLTNFNIASAFPTKIIKDYYPQKGSHTKHAYSHMDIYNNNNPQTINVKPPVKQIYHNVYDYQNPIPVPVKVDYGKPTEATRTSYFSKSEKAQRYKLVPYDQTPPILVPNPTEDIFIPKLNPYYEKPVPTVASGFKNINYQNQQYFHTAAKDAYSNNDKHRPKQIFYFAPAEETQYNDPNNIEYSSEPSYKFKKPYNLSPITQSGFKPIINTATTTPATKVVYITSSNYVKPSFNDAYSKQVTTVKPKLHYQIQTTKKPAVVTTYTENSEDYDDLSPNYGPSGDSFDQNNLAQILKTLQDSHSLPQKITADNVDSSIKTLVQIINNLKAKHNQEEDSSGRPLGGISSTYKPPTNTISTSKPRPNYTSRYNVKSTLKPPVSYDYSQDLESEHPGIQDIDNEDGDSLDDENGGTPGKPGVDYPILATIPATSFDCKAQRYKGFFGDPDTNCQVWHYCDLNGGQASFLCPNGTIFSQVALTCDWWFNVKCDTTPQLYVLNERLYKYILPYTPKFPEDYSGPLVDKYLTIKYKEMEEDRRKKEEKEAEDKEKDEDDEQESDEQDEVLAEGPKGGIDTHQLDVIEINTSGMSGALRPYENREK